MRSRIVVVIALVGALSVPVVAGWSGEVSAQEVAASGRRCFTVAGSPGDAVLVNLTPVDADGAGDGQLVSSDVTTTPLASNVNFGPGTVDPNVAVAPIGADGQVCYVNSVHTSVHLVADHLGTITTDSFQQATSTGAPKRIIDTRTTDQDGSLIDQLVVAPQNTSAPYDRDDWPHWIDADGDCQNTRAEVLIRDSRTSVTFTNSSSCVVAEGNWLDPWTSLTFTAASDVDIDHTVALANAHHPRPPRSATDPRPRTRRPHRQRSPQPRTTHTRHQQR